mgnify:CR=1 FL=1
MANGLLSQYQVNPFQKPETMTQEQFKQSMIRSYNPSKDPNTMFLSPTLTDQTSTVMTPYGPRDVTGKKITSLIKSGEEIEAEKKVITDKEKAFTASDDTIKDTLPDKGESLLPDAKLTGKSFMDKLQSGIDKIFNMQENDPAAYRRMMSGIDLYSRSQTQDLATALLGNNKFNQDQARALLQSNKNAMEMKVLEARYAKSLQPEAASTSEIEVAKGIVSGKVDKDDVDSIANYIAGDAKVLMQSIPGLAYNQAVVIAFQQAQQSGILKEKGFFKKKLEFDPNAAVSKSATLKQLQELNPGLSEEAIRKQAKIEGVTIK